MQPQSGPAPAVAAKVSIAGFAFGPQAITVKAGERITWTNNDGAAHTVTFKDGSASSKSLAPGDVFTRAFDRPGTYAYACSFHPYMTGTVIVQANRSGIREDAAPCGGRQNAGVLLQRLDRNAV